MLWINTINQKKQTDARYHVYEFDPGGHFFQEVNHWNDDKLCSNSFQRDAGVTATANKESYHDNSERLPRQSAGCKHDNSHDKNSLYGSTAL